MKNLVAVLLIAASLFAVSCQKEITGEILPVVPGGGSGGTGGTLDKCITCDYFPICNKMWYEYVDSSGSGLITTRDTLYLVKDTVIKTIAYTKIRTAPNVNQYYSCIGGVVRAYGVTVDITSGAQAFTDLTMLKSTQPIGTTWTDLVTNFGTTAEYKFTIDSKAPLSVSGKTYNDVIKVKLITSALVFGISIPTVETDYYYAKDVGLVYAYVLDLLNGEESSRTLKSYFIK